MPEAANEPVEVYLESEAFKRKLLRSILLIGVACPVVLAVILVATGAHEEVDHSDPALWVMLAIVLPLATLGAHFYDIQTYYLCRHLRLIIGDEEVEYRVRNQVHATLTRDTIDSYAIHMAPKTRKRRLRIWTRDSKKLEISESMENFEHLLAFLIRLEVREKGLLESKKGEKL